MKEKHLEMIQGVVNRLSHNSFLLKGWAVILVSVLLAAAIKEGGLLFAGLALLPALVFWGLDGYFLRQERLFRALYDHVRKLDGEPDFSMDTRIVKNQVASWCSVCRSKTLRWFHGVLVVVIASVVILTFLVSEKGSKSWQDGPSSVSTTRMSGR